MTEREAQRILAEHRTDCPSFVRGRTLYKVRRDGRIDVYALRGKIGRSAVFDLTVDRAWVGLHPDVARALA